MQAAGMVLGSRLVRPLTAFSQDSASDRANHRLSVTDSHYKRVRSYIEDEPVPEYRWASDATYEAFQDMKYGIRIHWGLYSVAGFMRESWPFLELDYPERARLQRYLQNMEPHGVRCRCLDVALRRERSAHVRLHYQASQGLFNVRHAHAREATSSLGCSRKPATGELRSRVLHHGDAVQARRCQGTVRGWSQANFAHFAVLLPSRLVRRRLPALCR